MKSERKAVLLAITENIEMELLSSEEPCVVIQEKEEEYSFHQVCVFNRNLNILKRQESCGDPHTAV